MDDPWHCAGVALIQRSYSIGIVLAVCPKYTRTWLVLCCTILVSVRSQHAVQVAVRMNYQCLWSASNVPVQYRYSPTVVPVCYLYSTCVVPVQYQCCAT